MAEYQEPVWIETTTPEGTVAVNFSPSAVFEACLSSSSSKVVNSTRLSELAGESYFYNSSTLETTWERPQDGVVVSRQQARNSP